MCEVGTELLCQCPRVSIVKYSITIIAAVVAVLGKADPRVPVHNMSRNLLLVIGPVMVGVQGKAACCKC